MEKNQYGDFSGSIQNRVQLDPTVTNDASQSKTTIWKDIASWFTEEMQICRREKSLGLRKTPTVKKHKLGELWFRSELCYTRIYSCQISQESPPGLKEPRTSPAPKSAAMECSHKVALNPQPPEILTEHKNTKAKSNK